MQHQPYNQLPPLRQPLSDPSSRSNDPGPSTSNNPSSRPDSHVNNHNTSDLPSPRLGAYQHQHQQQQHHHPSLTLPLPGTTAGVDQPHSRLRPGEAQLHPPHHSPRDHYPPDSRASSSRSQQSDMMYPNYSQQYPSHPLQPNAQYAAMPQHQQQGRMLPSAHQSMLPPVYPQSSYAAPSLPGPLTYDNGSAQQIPTPASTTHTLTSSNSAALGTDATFQGTRGNYKYELRVEQQPQRARMCGFGDKDRRPITPPPCVRLIVRRIDTDEEVDVDKLEGQFMVLQVDLWDADGTREVNIIRASSTAPSSSISTAVQMGYPPPTNPMYMNDMSYSMNQFGMQNYALPQQISNSNSHVMFTRNLIGSLTANASLLKDTDGTSGYWFVLSDLSVRTEGWFRLKMTFIDIGTPGPNPGETVLNQGRCPVLATCFSDKFQVYSAKKFPGVIESTPLSKCFAHQGIKIPIRKDGKNDKNDDDEDDYKRN